LESADFKPSKNGTALQIAIITGGYNENYSMLKIPVRIIPSWYHHRRLFTGGVKMDLAPLLRWVTHCSAP
jgi:hypothetical protein